MSKYLPIISLCAMSLCGCEDEEVCGPGEVEATQLTASVGSSEIAVAFVDWRASPNNDCGEEGGPISLTLEATQEGQNLGLALCLPRPDLLGPAEEDLFDAARVRLIDIFAKTTRTLNGQEVDCTSRLDRVGDSSGSASFPGLCGDGDDPAGFALQISWDLAMETTCGEEALNERLTLSGEVVVATPN